MGDRCIGDCCRAFVLSGTYGELLRSYDAWRARQPTSIRHGGGQMGIINDVWILALMIRPLGEFRVNPVTGAKYAKPVAFYSCSHLNANGDCGIYDRRPAMCRNFPYGKECENPKCSWDQVKRISLGRRLVQLFWKGFWA